MEASSVASLEQGSSNTTNPIGFNEGGISTTFIDGATASIDYGVNDSNATFASVSNYTTINLNTVSNAATTQLIDSSLDKRYDGTKDISTSFYGKYDQEPESGLREALNTTEFWHRITTLSTSTEERVSDYSQNDAVTENFVNLTTDSKQNAPVTVSPIQSPSKGFYQLPVSKITSENWEKSINETLLELFGFENEGFFANDTVYSEMPDYNTTEFFPWNCTDTDNITLCANFSTNSSDTFDGDLQYWPLILLLIPFFTVFGNVLVVLSVFKERSLQHVTNYFIVSLAVADIMVAILVMPAAVYVEIHKGRWLASDELCDAWVSFDVMFSTASILNLTAISVDRYIAITQPIKYAKHKNSKRVYVTLALVWTISMAIALPLATGQNNTPDRQKFECRFYNADFLIYSSLGSFYIPCIIMVFLYWRIFLAIHRRAQKAKKMKQPKVIANPAKNHRDPEVDKCEAKVEIQNEKEKDSGHLSMDTATESPKNDGPKIGVLPDISELNGLISDRFTDYTNLMATVGAITDNNGITLPPEAEEEDIWVLRPDFAEQLRKSEFSESATDNEDSDSHVIANNKGALELKDIKSNHKAHNNVRHNVHAEVESDSTDSTPKRSKSAQRLFQNAKRKILCRNGSAAMVTTYVPEQGENRTVTKFHFAVKHRKTKKEKASKERKATKTLAIVLGVFLFCWVPFFTINIMSAICIRYSIKDTPACNSIDLVLFTLFTWIGYINSGLNPVIYTIFNMEFRKAFKKLLQNPCR